jgi:PTS system nitrogen regulatory IIA component
LDLSLIFDPRACVVGARPAGKRAALRMAAQLLARRLRMGAGPAAPAGTIEAALAAREARGSTGFGGGMAIPHARLAGLTGMAGALLKLERPVPFDSFDGAPVWLLVALAGPEAGGAQHLKAMARIARVLRAEGKRLAGARDVPALFTLMTGGEKVSAVG